MKEIREGVFKVIFLKTEFKKFSDIKRALDKMDRSAKLTVINVYKELNELDNDSRFEDWCLLTVAYEVCKDREVLVVSRDRGIKLSCEALRELGVPIKHYSPKFSPLPSSLTLTLP